MKWTGVGDEMAVTVEMQNTGDPALRQEVVATVEHVLSDRGLAGFNYWFADERPMGDEDHWAECF